MLEVKNLVKTYSGKGGVVVKALDDVSVRFPETGMVFLLGKSGSGKSTLLNVAGGLDKPDGGEIIVKGRSSKDFSAADFDSYRNTFVGFVFQEYNILNEFTIEQNIALALQLQNKPNDKKAVAELLEQVDLKDFGKRKPNTLSGGQKQRVAIARALIKNPEIIMADEPTGALDSNTGKQVLDTLKKLSEKKLVIVVSHDREFAEFYGDRIIELKDGKILSDVSKTYFVPENSDKNVQMIGDDTITVKNAGEITEKDVKEIVAMLQKNGGEAIITASKRELPDVKRACKINENGSKESFKDTDLENVDIKDYDGKETGFIKSRLPAGHAFKMGASGLKSKPIRLIFTIILAVAAFIMFGVVSTFMFYDQSYSISKALQEAEYAGITLNKYYSALYESVRTNNETGETTVTHSHEENLYTLFGASELEEKSVNGLKFAGIFNFSESPITMYAIQLKKGDGYIPVSVASELSDYYPLREIYGFTDCGADFMSENGFRLTGAYPQNATEIAVPEYIANLFVNTTGSELTSAADIIGKSIRIYLGSEKYFTVTGVYNVGAIPAKYDKLKTLDSSMSNEEKNSLKMSLADYLGNGFNSVLYVSGDFYDEHKDSVATGNGIYINGIWADGLIMSEYPVFFDEGPDYRDAIYFTDETVRENPDYFKIYDLNGERKDYSANDGQVYLPYAKYSEMVRVNLRFYADTLINEREFDGEARTDLAVGGEFDTAYGNYYNEDNYKTVLFYVNKWYTELKYKSYVYNAAKLLRETGDPVYNSGDFDAAYIKLDNFLQYVGEEPTDEEWETLALIVESDYKLRFPQQYYYDYANEAYTKRPDLFENVLTYEIIDRLSRGVCSSDEFDAVKNAVDADYAVATGHEMNTGKDRFVFNTETLFGKIYYKDKNNVSGTLEIAGYFTANDLDSSFLVTKSFLIAHATFAGYTWSSRYTSAYTVPEDAKYNAATTLSDNSQEQIYAALSANGVVSYRINNNVALQLEIFLNMINSMKKIFLIVGAIVGAFAALMLLNFISVSISAKRKDIGILRAVGARGSDVFKIFFSEAFIIAIICFVLATIGSFIVCFELNKSLVTIVRMQLLDFNLLNVAFILAVSLAVSVVATFLPVYFAAKKSPVESIRAL